MLKAILLQVGLTVFALAAQNGPAFDVASVKPTLHGRNAEGLSISGVEIPSPGRLVAENSSLGELIRFAYGLKDYQVAGPAWLNDDNESFDIVAAAPAGTPDNQMPLILRALLADRFEMTAHTEKQIRSVYNLTATRSARKLQPAVSGERKGTSSDGRTLTATNVTMADFAYELSRQLKRPVLDQTGIAGAFDIRLQYSRLQPEQDEGSAAPTLVGAIQSLGLKLQSGKAPIDVLVIDHIDRAPTEN